MHIHGSMSFERNSRRMDTFQKMFYARVPQGLLFGPQISNQTRGLAKFGTARDVAH